MTNEEEPSVVLGAAKIVNGLKKRKGLDIDALWRKKFKDVEDGKSPSKLEELLSISPSEESKSTRTARRKKERKSEESGQRNMEESEDVKPNVKVLKKAVPISFQCSTIDDGVVGDASANSSSSTDATSSSSAATNNMLVDPNKISLGSYGEESQDEMEAMARASGVDDPNSSRDGAGYEFAAMEYPSAVTPNGSAYTLYAADSNSYAPYYQLQYPTNMQASPQDSSGYLVVHGSSQPPNAHSPMSMDDNDSSGLNHNTRASPATINWLLDNYETADGSSLPRCQLYDHYRKHCTERRLDPVNAASFGKLIRSVFIGLKTRRLGTRGNSKYHYYGIRIKDSSNLNVMGHQAQHAQQHGGHIPQYVCTPPMPQRDAYADTVNSVAAVKYVDVEPPVKRHCKDNSSSSSSCRDSASPSLELPMQPILHQTAVSAVPVLPQPSLAMSSALLTNYKFTDKDREAMGKLEMPQIPFQNQEHLLASFSFRKLGFGADALTNLIDSYDYMCREILELVKNVEFSAVEDVWFKYWAGVYGIDHDTLLALCSIERVQEYIIEVDLALYQTIVDCLIPNVLLSELSPGMTQLCRTFGKNIDIYLRKALINGKTDDSFVKKKIQAIKYMQQGLKRYTSLNHLAHAARGVLMKHEQCQQMFQDYLKVDINAVHQQAGWICGCDSVMVHHVNNAFKHNLQKGSPMEDWAEWLESIVDQVLAKYHDKPANVVSNVGKQFLLNWSFYTSMIIRDLTLRSAMSFGSFTLIRLLADDYMYYLIESKIAKAGKQQLITVIRQEKDWPLSPDTQEYIVPSNDEDLELEKNGLLDHDLQL